MDLPGGSEKRRGEGRRNPAVINRRKPPVDTRYAAAIICLQVLSIQAATIQFTKEPKSQDALHGRSAMLRCEVSDPADISYSWLHNGQPLENSERRFQEGSNLKFTAVDRRLDAGNFVCVAQNPLTGELLHSTNASFNIKWLESGGVTLKEPASEGEIESSAPVTLRCHIDGHPRPTCQWFKDGLKLTEKSHQINNKERTLTFKSANKSIPWPVVTPEDQVVLRNDEAVFHCQFTAVPPPTVEWYHENELLVNKTRVFMFSNGTLLITQVKHKNTGTYKCVGRGTSCSFSLFTSTSFFQSVTAVTVTLDNSLTHQYDSE
ncbi:hypothetical protein PAMP_001910 [Pampus punctatissimus]